MEEKAKKKIKFSELEEAEDEKKKKAGLHKDQKLKAYLILDWLQKKTDRSLWNAKIFRLIR